MAAVSSIHWAEYSIRAERAWPMTRHGFRSGVVLSKSTHPRTAGKLKHGYPFKPREQIQ